MVRGDPTEGTLLVTARKAGKDIEMLKKEWPRIYEVPFDSSRKRMITVHEHEGKRFAYSQGGNRSCPRHLHEEIGRGRDRTAGRSGTQLRSSLRPRTWRNAPSASSRSATDSLIPTLN